MTDRQEGKTQPALTLEPAREDDGPVHGSTPPHGDIFGYQIVNEAPELDEDAEEKPLVQS